MKAVIYARYSSSAQREESIEGQVKECTTFAERNGYTIIGTYADRAISGTTDNRPQFQKMIEDSKRKLFDVVIVWKLDRFARNRYDSARYKNQLKKNGVKLISATEVIAPGAEGILLESVLEGYAEYFSDITITNFGWLNSFNALIIPFLVSVFYIYLLRQNFMQIPNELYLAAKVDGTSDLKYLWKVMVPLSMPTLISITILKMMGAWNSYIWPRLVANDEAHRMITNGLRNAFTDVSGQTNFPVQMAAVAIVSAPLFMVFLFLRKYIMAGVSRSGIKG